MDEGQNFTGNTRRKIFRFIFVLAAMFILSFAVLLLWNAILPQTVHVSNITYWQALGLLVLSRLLFGNFNFGFPFGGQSRGRGPDDEFMNFKGSDKATFKEEWKKRCEQWGKK